MVRELRTDDEARVRSAVIFERDTRAEEEIHADVFAVCGGNIESLPCALKVLSQLLQNQLVDVLGELLHFPMIS